MGHPVIFKGDRVKVLNSGGFDFKDGTIIRYGGSSPEGVVAAPTGSLFINKSDPADFFLKETGAGNTGWLQLLTVNDQYWARSGGNLYPRTITDFVGIGVIPETKFHFADGDSGFSPGGDIFWESSNVLNMEIAFGAGANFQMNVSEVGGEFWQMAFDGSTNQMRFFNGTIGQWLVQSSGEIVINDSGSSIDLRVEGDTDVNMIFGQGSTNFVGFGTNSPDRKLHPELSDAINNAVSFVQRITHITTGTPGAGIGTGLEFETQTAVGNNEVGLNIQSITDSVTSTSETFHTLVRTMKNGTLADSLYFDADKLGVYGGIIELSPGFLVGNIRFQSNTVSIYGGTSGIVLNDSGGTGRVALDSSNNFGIGVTSSILTRLHVRKTTVTTPVLVTGAIALFEDNIAIPYIQVQGTTDGGGGLVFGDKNSPHFFRMEATIDNAFYQFLINDTDVLHLGTGFVWNPNSGNQDYQINGDTVTSLFFSDASTDSILIGTNAQVMGNRFQINTGNVNMGWKQATVNTTNATVTTIATIAIPTDRAVLVKGFLIARRTGGSSGAANDSAGYERTFVAKNTAGTVTINGLQTDFTFENQAAWDLTFAVSGTNVLAQVTGATNNNVTWDFTYTSNLVSA